MSSLIEIRRLLLLQRTRSENVFVSRFSFFSWNSSSDFQYKRLFLLAKSDLHMNVVSRVPSSLVLFERQLIAYQHAWFFLLLCTTCFSRTDFRHLFWTIKFHSWRVFNFPKDFRIFRVVVGSIGHMTHIVHHLLVHNIRLFVGHASSPFDHKRIS